MSNAFRHLTALLTTAIEQQQEGRIILFSLFVPRSAVVRSFGRSFYSFRCEYSQQPRADEYNYMKSMRNARPSVSRSDNSCL